MCMTVPRSKKPGETRLLLQLQKGVLKIILSETGILSMIPPTDSSYHSTLYHLRKKFMKKKIIISPISISNLLNQCETDLL